MDKLKKYLLHLLGGKSFFVLEFYYLLRHAAFQQGRDFFCPCCGAGFYRFIIARTFSGNVIPNLICPRCDSHPRHRLLWMFLKHKRTDLFEKRIRLLHFAPEFCFARHFRKMKNLEYVTFDMTSPFAEFHGDICALPFADSSFDVILCNHVLEHVSDDEKAMSELFRVLRPDGWGIIQVPLNTESSVTVENPLVIDPRERERLYGQYDHVRLYGRDYVSRLWNAGFSVDVIDFTGSLDESSIARNGLDKNEAVYICSRRSDAH